MATASIELDIRRDWAWGVDVFLSERNPTELCFFSWQVLELLPRSIDMFALSYGWAPEFVASQDPSEQARLLGNMQQTSAIIDSIGYGRRAVWAAGHLFF